MKRTIMLLVLCLALLFCFPICANSEGAEITFNKIPWLSDDVTVIQQLKEGLYLSKEIGVPNLNNENCLFLISDGEGFVQPVMYKEYKDVCRSIILQNQLKGKIAGHPISNLILSFAYDGSNKLISVKVELIGATYTELKEKLEKVYGEREEIINNEGIKSTSWSGEGETCILLYDENADDSYELIYGRLDAEEILANCLAAPDPDDVSGL